MSLSKLYRKLVDGERFMVRFVFLQIFHALFEFSINVISITWRPLTNFLVNGKDLWTSQSSRWKIVHSKLINVQLNYFCNKDALKYLSSTYRTNYIFKTKTRLIWIIFFRKFWNILINYRKEKKRITFIYWSINTCCTQST